MSETAEDRKLYQWLKTDSAGDYAYAVDEEEEDGMTFIVLDDGQRFNKELIGDVAIEVQSTDDGFIITTEIINDVTKAKGADGKEYEIPGPTHGKTRTVKKPKPRAKALPTQRKPEPPKPAPIADPVMALLEQAKKSKHVYEIELNVDTIPLDLYNVVKGSFDGGEDKMLDYIVSLIDIEMLKEHLKEKLKSIYNEK